MTVIAYKVGKRIRWGFNVEVVPWTYDGKYYLIVDSIGLPSKDVKVLSSETEKELLTLSKQIQELQEKAQRIVEQAYPNASQWENRRGNRETESK